MWAPFSARGNLRRDHPPVGAGIDRGISVTTISRFWLPQAWLRVDGEDYA